MQRPAWLPWPHSPGTSLGVFLTLGVVAVGLITWVGVSASHRQASQTSAAVAQGQGLADPILQLCGQGGDVALRLQGAGLCDAAQNVKADPVAPPAALSGPQVQTMIDNAVRNRAAALPPPSTAPATPAPTPQQIQDMINNSIDSRRPPAQAAAPSPRQQPAPPPYYPPPAPQYQQPAYQQPPQYQQPQYPNYPPTRGYPSGGGWPSDGGTRPPGGRPPRGGGGGQWPPVGGSGGGEWPPRGGGGYPGQPPYQYSSGYPGGYGGAGYPYPGYPSYPSYPQQPYPYPAQQPTYPSYPQPRPQPVERGGGGRQSDGGGLIGQLGLHVG
jgi:hypothetical protein